jgi:RNA polymerase sigma-70 factor, ECF subfamily
MITLVLPDIPMEDRLLARARNGDKTAMMQIYESYFDAIYSYLRLRVDDAMLAEDLTSDVFLKLMTALNGRNAPQHSLRGWLFKVARNALHDHYGYTRKMPTTTIEEWVGAPSDDEPEIAFIRDADAERSRRAIKMLAAEQQEVLVLRFGQALSLQETADIMGKSVSAIKSLQFRAVDTLKRILGEVQETGNAHVS